MSIEKVEMIGELTKEDHDFMFAEPLGLDEDYDKDHDDIKKWDGE